MESGIDEADANMDCRGGKQEARGVGGGQGKAAIFDVVAPGLLADA